MGVADKAVNKEAQEFLGEEIVRHADTHGFAFLLDQETLLEKVMEAFGLSRSEALWQVTVFIQGNSGPEGDLVVIIAGSPPGIPGSTNALRIHRIGDAINEVAPAYERKS